MNFLAGRGAWIWRLPAWVAIVVATVVSTHSTTSRVVAGLTLGVAAVALQFTRSEQLTTRRIAIFVSIAGGLAACFAAHDGIAEIPVIVAMTRLPEVSDGATLRWLTAAGALAFGGTIAFISRSYPGLLAGIAVPLLVQRSLEHRDLIRERDRAQALLAEVQAGREAEAQAAALRERGRIAREMHDVLAHTLAGLSVQLQAVRAVAAREGVGAEVLEPIDRAAALAKDGLQEARAAVGALRDPIGLGLAELPSLVERHPGRARFQVAGAPREVTAEAGHAVYRAVQEALTNAARYAPGSPVSVELRWSAEALEAVVSDEGPGPDRSAVAEPGTGLGLAGMDERIRSVGGTLHAGPGPERGWRIEIRVPARVSEGAAT